MTMSERAVVLHSGGQDSSTCLAWAINHWGAENVFPLVINYGQRHKVEIEQARKVVDALLPARVARELDLGVLRELGGAALTDDDVKVSTDANGSGNVFAETHGLPSTFVPGRNALFLTTAAAYGATIGADNIVTGVCATDEAGYPDCRPEFVRSQAVTLRIALDEPFIEIHAPLIHLSKAQTFALASELDVLDLIVDVTHTCYHGDREHKHDWGYGCGECGACEERAKGWAEFDAPAAA